MSADAIATIWAGLIAFAVVAYVMLDGYDLGVGILFAAERGSDHRDTMVDFIAPMWDGNETWLLLGGGGLFAVFPEAYAVMKRVAWRRQDSTSTICTTRDKLDFARG